MSEQTIASGTSKTHTRPWLRLAQVAWVVATLLVIGMYLAGAVIYYESLRQVCAAPAQQCQAFDYATPIQAAQLAATGVSLDTYAVLRLGLRVVLALAPLALGLLIFARNRAQPIRLVISFFLIQAATAGEPHAALAAAVPAFALPSKVFELVWAISLALFFGMFPNGRVVPRLFWVVIVYFCGMYFLEGIVELIDLTSWFGALLSWVGWLSLLLGGTAAQVYRYVRVSAGEERRQTRWVLFGFMALALTLLSLLVFSGITSLDLFSETGPLLPRLAVVLWLNLAFQFIPLSIGMAILRSRLFDIDIIIRRTLIYSLLTLMLGLVYIGCIVVSRTFVAPFTGSSELAIVASTLAIAALFNPLRRRIQNSIDKRFYRRKYDAGKVLAAFAATARDETDLDALTAELLCVVDETMQPEFVGLWLRDPQARSKIESAQPDSGPPR
jgi:hypothetical protein